MGALVLGFLPSLFRGFRITYWWTSSSFREIEKFVDSASSFGLQVKRHGSISEAWNILLPFLMMTKLKTLRLGFMMQLDTDLHFLSSVLPGL